MEHIKKSGNLIHWFRFDLRLHDMPSMSAALNACSVLYPVYIFNPEEIAKCVGYNKIRFILESLKDIDTKLQLHGGRLYVFQGNPTSILSSLFKKWNITHLSYELEVQPHFEKTECEIEQLCKENNIEIVRKVSRTLWNLNDILKANGGRPPVTYTVFCQVSEVLGRPSRPEPDVNLQDVSLPIDGDVQSHLPLNPEELGLSMECDEQRNKVWTGGETCALQHLEVRLKLEEKAFASTYCNVYVMPNQAKPDLLGPPMSMSAAVTMGCLSVRKFYWSICDLYKSVSSDNYFPEGLMGQLVWRDYFYTMCMNNPHYGTMLENPICLNIPWTENKPNLDCWAEGRTGFPFIDAAMRQLRQEGWIHHVARNAVACFLTRGDLWISWEKGLHVFMKYLIDADLPVCAGNWMWVSSSAFENVLQCSACISPISYGRRFEPSGKYIKKYVPELKMMPIKYLFEPWLAPLSVQESSNCIIGKDYPYPIIDHQAACARNAEQMALIKQSFLPKSIPPHCSPTDSGETRIFMWLPKKCVENLFPYCD